MGKESRESRLDKNKGTRKEKYGKTTWRSIYSHGKPAKENVRTGEIFFPSDRYVKMHHPRGRWDS